MWQKKIKKIQKLIQQLENNEYGKKEVIDNITEIEHIFFECFDYDRKQARCKQNKNSGDEEERNTFENNEKNCRKIINTYFIPYVNLMLEQVDQFGENYNVEKESLLTRILNFFTTIIQINKNYSYLIIAYYVNLIEKKNHLLKIVKYLKKCIICLLKGLLFNNFFFIDHSEPVREGFENYIILKSKIFNILKNFHFDSHLKNNPYKYDIIKNLMELVTKEISYLFHVLKYKKQIFTETLSEEKKVPEVINEIFDYSYLTGMVNKANLNNYDELVIIWLEQNINMLNELASFNLENADKHNELDNISDEILRKKETKEKEEKEETEKRKKTEEGITDMTYTNIAMDVMKDFTKSNNIAEEINVDSIILMTYLMKNIFKLMNQNPFTLNFFINNIFLLVNKMLLLKNKFSKVQKNGKNCFINSSDNGKNNNNNIQCGKYKLVESVYLFIKEELYILLCKDDANFPFFYSYITQLLNIMGEKGNANELIKKKKDSMSCEIEIEKDLSGIEDTEMEREIGGVESNQKRILYENGNRNNEISEYLKKSILRKENNCYKKVKNEEIDIMSYLKVKFNELDKKNDSLNKRDKNKSDENELKEKEEKENMFINKIVKKLYLTNFKLDKEKYEKYECAKKKKVFPSVQKKKKSICIKDWSNKQKKEIEDFDYIDYILRLQNETNKFIQDSSCTDRSLSKPKKKGNDIFFKNKIKEKDYKYIYEFILSSDKIYFDSVKPNDKILGNIDLYYFVIFTQLLNNDLDNNIPIIGENIYLKKINNYKIINNIVKRIIINDMLSNRHKFFFLVLYILKVNSLNVFTEETTDDMFCSYSTVFKILNNFLFFAYVQEEKQKIRRKKERGKRKGKEKKVEYILGYTRYCYNYFYKIKKKLKKKNYVYRSELEKPGYQLKCTYDEIFNLIIYFLYNEKLLTNFRDQYIKTFIEQLLEVPKLSFSFFVYLILWINDVHIDLEYENYINSTNIKDSKMESELLLEKSKNDLMLQHSKDMNEKEIELNQKQKQKQNQEQEREQEGDFKDIYGDNDKINLQKDKINLREIGKNENIPLFNTEANTNKNIKNDLDSTSESDGSVSFFEVNLSEEEEYGKYSDGIFILQSKKIHSEKSKTETNKLVTGTLQQNQDLQNNKKKEVNKEEVTSKGISVENATFEKDNFMNSVIKEENENKIVMDTYKREVDALFNVNQYIRYNERAHIAPNTVFCFSILSNLIKKNQNINVKKTLLSIYIKSIYTCNSETRNLLKKLITATKGIYNNTLNYCYVYTKRIYNYFHKIYLLFLFFVCVNFFPNLKNDLLLFSHFPCYTWPIALIRFLHYFLTANFSHFYQNITLIFSSSVEIVKSREKNTFSSFNSFLIIDKQLEEYLSKRDDINNIQSVELFLKETDFFNEKGKSQSSSLNNYLTGINEKGDVEHENNVQAKENIHRDTFQMDEEKECFRKNEIVQKALIEEVIVLLFIKTIDLFEDRLLIPKVQKMNIFFNFSRIHFVDELNAFVIQNVEYIYVQEKKKFWEGFDHFIEESNEDENIKNNNINHKDFQNIKHLFVFLQNSINNFLSICVRTSMFFHFYLFIFTCCENDKIKQLLRKNFLQTLPQLKPWLHEELFRILEYNNKEDVTNENTNEDEKNKEDINEKEEMKKKEEDSFIINIDIVKHVGEKLHDTTPEESNIKFLNFCFNLYLKNKNIFFIIELITFLRKEQVLQIFNDIINMNINENEKIEFLKKCIDKIIKLPYACIKAKKEQMEREMEQEKDNKGANLNKMSNKKPKTVDNESYYITNIEIFYFYYNLNKNKNIQRVLLDYFVTQVNVNTVNDTNDKIQNDITIKDLACIIQQIAESTNAIFPIYGRFLCQVTKNINILREFVSSIVIPLLIQKKIWNNKSIWKGCLMCISMLWPDYSHSLFYVFFMLPPEESVNLFQALQQKHPIASDLKNLISSNEQAKRMCPEHLKNLLTD